MAVRKKGDRWVVEFMQRGVRVFRRLPAGRNKGDAQQLESKLRGQVFNAVDLGKLPDPLLSKVIDEWLKTKKGSKAEKQTASHANAVLGAIGDSALLSGLVGVAEQLRSIDRLSAATRNRRLCILKAVAKYAYQKGYTQTNLSGKIQLLPERGYQRREVNPEAIKALLNEANTPRAKALIAFGAFTGMRLGEVLKLRPEDVVGGYIRVLDPKNGHDRNIPIPKELEPHLSALPFKSNWRNVYRGFLSARKRAGLTLRYHDLRHMAATAMAEGGAHPLIIADVLGHKSLQTTRKYTHPSLEAKAKAMKAITSGLHRGKKKSP